MAVAAGVVVACGGTSAPSADRDDGPLAESGQLIVGIAESWDSHDVQLQLYERTGGGAWTAIGSSWQGTVGSAGIAWGRGLHGEGAPGARPGPVKREGDKRSPAGVFGLRSAYGYSPTNVVGARISYAELTPSWRCVDDSASPNYNKVLNAEGREQDWTSAEQMRRSDAQYEWVIEIGHNQAAAPGGGSCIFFHVWSGEGSPTVGCTAMTKPAIETLLAELDPAATPVYVLLPAAEYEALRGTWHLP